VNEEGGNHTKFDIVLQHTTCEFALSLKKCSNKNTKNIDYSDEGACGPGVSLAAAQLTQRMPAETLRSPYQNSHARGPVRRSVGVVFAHNIQSVEVRKHIWSPGSKKLAWHFCRCLTLGAKIE